MSFLPEKNSKRITGSPDQVFLARQPVFDRNLEVVAYELLFRAALSEVAVIDDATYATAKLITNTFLEIGLANICGGKLAFINLPRPFITGEVPILLDPNQVVLEILEDVCAEDATLRGIQRLVSEGYTIALDDFLQTDANKDFIPFASIIKIDVLGLTEAELSEQVAGFAGFSGKLLAEKVETEEQYLFCRSLGFALFQGYFFSKPKIIEGRELQANHINLLMIIAKLQDPECRLQDIEGIFSNDVGMSYKLFKIINSPYYGVGRKIESIQHALVLLGFETIKKWIILISLPSLNSKPRELIVSALIRAKMCETVAGNLGYKSEIAFTLGMFSLLDAIMDRPLTLIVESLPLSVDVKTALLNRDGPQGELLAAVIDYERGEWHNLDDRFMQQGQISQAYRGALSWCADVSGELHNA